MAGCDGSLHVIDLEKRTEAAAVDLQSPTGSTAAVRDGIAYVGTEGNFFLAVDLRRLKILWRYEDHEHAMPFRSSAAVTDNLVLVGSRGRSLEAIDRRTGHRRWRFSTRGQVDSSPVVVGQRRLRHFRRPSLWCRFVQQ